MAPSVTSSSVLAAFSVSLGSLLVGFSSAWSSPAIASLQAATSKVNITDTDASWIGSLLPLAALVGGLAGGPALEALGRRNTIGATAPPLMAAALVVALAEQVTTICIGRAITGFCIGLISLSLPVYLAETLQPEVRGILGMLPTSLGNLGVMLCYICGSWLDWAELSSLAAALALPFLIFMFAIPETPRFLYSKGKTDLARTSLQWLRGKDADVSEEMTNIHLCQSAFQKNSMKIADLRFYLHPIGISLGLMTFQQLSGINAVLYYSVSIFRDSGSSISPHLSTIILGIVNIISTVTANILIDRLGRKILLSASSFGMIISLAVLGTYYHFQTSASPPGWIPLVALVIYITSFSLGFGPIPWLMMGEIFPARIRGPAASLSTAFNWACTFVVTKTFLDLQAGLGAAGVFWMFGAVCVVGLVFVCTLVPETRGLSLEEIEELFMGKIGDKDFKYRDIENVGLP